MQRWFYLRAINIAAYLSNVKMSVIFHHSLANAKMVGVIFQYYKLRKHFFDATEYDYNKLSSYLTSK